MFGEAAEGIVNHIIVAIEANAGAVTTCADAAIMVVPRRHTPSVERANGVDEPDALARFADGEGVARQTAESEVVVLVDPDTPASVADAATNIVNKSVAIDGRVHVWAVDGVRVRMEAGGSAGGSAENDRDGGKSKAHGC